MKRSLTGSVRAMRIMVALVGAFVGRAAWAQATFLGEAGQSIDGGVVASTLGDTTSTGPSLASQTHLRLALSALGSRSTLTAELRALLGVDAYPTFLVAPTAQDPEALLRVGRVQPQARLAATFRPDERWGLSLNLGVQSHRNLGDHSSVSLEPGVSSPTGSSTPWESAPEGSVLNPGSSLATPPNALTLEGGLSVFAAPGLRTAPGLSTSYRRFRPLACSEGATGTVLESADFGNHIWTASPQLTRALSEVQRLTFSLTAQQDLNAPLAVCFQGENLPPRGQFNQVVPGVGWSLGGERGSLGVRLGGTLIWSTYTDASGIASTSGGTDVRPTGHIDAKWLYSWGFLSGGTGLEVVTLLGQSVPTYNQVWSISAGYLPADRWSLQGHLGYVQARALSSALAQGATSSVAGSRLLTGQLQAWWRPRNWFLGQLGYTLSTQRRPLGTSDARVEETITQGEAKVFSSLLSAGVTLVLDRGAWRPGRLQGPRLSRLEAQGGDHE